MIILFRRNGLGDMSYGDGDVYKVFIFIFQCFIILISYSAVAGFVST